MAQFYIARPPQQLGCFSLDEVVEKLYFGEFRADDLAFKQGFPDWKKISEIPELMDKLKLLQELMDKLIAPALPSAAIPLPSAAPAAIPKPSQAVPAILPARPATPSSITPTERQACLSDDYTLEERLVPIPKAPAPLENPAEPTQTDQVNFSAMAQGQLEAGAQFILDIWAYTESQTNQLKELADELGRGQMKGTKRGIGIEQGSVLEVHLSLPGFEVADPVDLLTWNGEPVNVSFPVTAPKDCTKGSHVGTATIHSHGLMICKLHFQIGAGAVSGLLTERPRTAFASYSSQNRNEVLGCLQGMQKVAPNLDVDIDVISLRSGQDYRETLGRLIPKKDVFFLFWSQAASESKEVEWEWRLALNNKGLGFIDPVPLEDPRQVPPPLELSSLHFGDKWISFKNATKQ